MVSDIRCCIQTPAVYWCGEQMQDCAVKDQQSGTHLTEEASGVHG